MAHNQILNVYCGPRYPYTGLVNSRKELLLVYPTAINHWVAHGGGDDNVHRLLNRAQDIMLASEDTVRQVPVRLVPYGESCSYTSYLCESRRPWPYGSSTKYTVKISGNPTTYHVEDDD